MYKVANRLNRFTTLPVLLDILQRKKLTLLDPKLWDDKNDAEVILAYKSKRRIKNLFALCFSIGDETVHHWKAFANGPSGCNIEFDSDKLFAVIDQVPQLRHGKVNYKKLSDVERKDSIIQLNEMPFTKRWPYRCEQEYRIIVESDREETFFEIEIPLEIIRRVTISQQMPKQVYSTIKEHLKTLKGNPEGRINRSTLYQNDRWISRFEE